MRRIASLWSFRLAAQHVRAHGGRMALSVVAVALGVALSVAFRMANASVLQSFVAAVDGIAGRAQLTVTAGDGFTFSDRVANVVAAVPGVTLSIPVVTGVAFPDDESGEMLTVQAFDLTDDAAVRVYHSDGAAGVVRDALEFLNSKDSIILGRAFASRRQLAVGDSIPLVTPVGLHSFVIRGLLEPEGLASVLGGRIVVMDIAAAQEYFAARDQLSRIDVLVGSANVETVRQAVAAVLPPGVRVEEPGVRRGLLARTVAGFQVMLTSFGLLGSLAGMVICYSRLSAVFEARAWEIGLLRAMGLRRSRVFVEMLKEAVLLGGAGAAVGIPLGAWIARYLLPLVASATALNFRLPAPDPSLAFGLDVVVTGVLIGVGAAVLGATLPAFRLAGTSPASTLRFRGREIESESSAGASVARWAVVVGVGASMLVQRATAVTGVGHVTTLLIAFAGYLCALPVLTRGGAVLGRLWNATFGVTGAVAVEYLRTHPRRLTPMVATIGVGVGGVFMFGMLGYSFERTLVEQLSHRFVSDLVVSSAHVSGGYRRASISEKLLTELRAVPGVDLVVGNQGCDVDLPDGPAAIDACDAGCFLDTRVNGWPLEPGAAPDVLARVERGEMVMVSSSFAAKRGTRPGDMVTLPTVHGARAFAVGAVTNASAEDAIVMARSLYRELWNDSSIYLAFVALRSGADRVATATAIRQRLGAAYRLQVLTSPELIDYFAGAARQAFTPLYLVESIALLLVLFGVGDTLAAGVIDRTRVLGMLRAIGLRSSHIFRLVLYEGVAVGVLGLALALSIGLALGLFWVKVQFPALLGWQLNFYLPVRHAVVVAMLTLTLCLLGAVVPSVGAARRSVVESLRDE